MKIFKKTTSQLNLGLSSYVRVIIPRTHAVKLLHLPEFAYIRKLSLKRYYYDGKNLMAVFLSPSRNTLITKDIFVIRDLASISADDELKVIYDKIHRQWLSCIKKRKFREG